MTRTNREEYTIVRRKMWENWEALEGKTGGLGLRDELLVRLREPGGLALRRGEAAHLHHPGSFLLGGRRRMDIQAVVVFARRASDAIRKT